MKDFFCLFVCFVFLGLLCQTEFCFLYVTPFEDGNYELAETLGDLNRFLNILFTAFPVL